jgi:amidase
MDLPSGVDLDVATAADLTRALREKAVSSRELLDCLLARVERRNPDLNAVVALDADRARAAAGAADEATARGEAAGRPLHGLPMTVKDVYETAGLVTASGAPALADHVPRADAVAVARLKAAGAIVFGKTNTPLFAGDWQTYNDVYGRTDNPWDLTRTAGGSSGGSAAAVAAGLTPLELGSDMGGSIRVPAHFNGVYGLKPSWGVVPGRGHIPGPPGSLVAIDVAAHGPLARGVADLRTALGVVAGPLPEDAAGWRLALDAGPPIDGGVAALRVATVFDEGGDFLPLAREVRAGLDAFAGRLADAGARIDAVPPPVPLAEGLRTWQDLVLPIAGSWLSDRVFAAMAAAADRDPGPGGDRARPVRAADQARALTAGYRAWARADERRQRERVAWARLFERYDVVLAPVMPTAAFPHDLDRPLDERVLDVDGAAVAHRVAVAWCAATASVLLPAVTLPTGPTPAGLPVGIQVIGPYLSDLRLLDVAELLDAAAGPGFTPPPLPARGRESPA